MEFNDIYDAEGNVTGRVHRRGSAWKAGEYGLVVCVWVYDGKGNILLTRRAKGKSFAGTWENSGGAVKAGEDSLTAIARELREETGIHAEPEEFEFLESGMDHCTHFDYYCLKKKVPLESVVLQPEETDENHMIFVERVEDEYYIRIEHDMTKQHYISFVAALSSDKIQMIKLYPEGNAEARFKINGVKKILFYCNRDGLFSMDVVKGIDDKRASYDDAEERRALEQTAKKLFG